MYFRFFAATAVLVSVGFITRGGNLWKFMKYLNLNSFIAIINEGKSFVLMSSAQSLLAPSVAFAKLIIPSNDESY